MNDNWTPNHGGKTQYAKKKHFAFNKDTNTIIFRVLPQPKGFKYGTVEYNNTPFSGDWHKFHTAIFGYKNTDGKFRTFESPLVKDNKAKTIKVPCAATDMITALKAKLEEARATGNAAVQPKLNTLVGLKGVYSIDNNQHLNVVLLDGSIGELKLRYKAFLALKAEIDKLRAGSKDELGFDPLSFRDGRFFVMTRNSAGRDTVFNVSVYKEKVEVAGYGKLEKPLVHSITPELLARLEVEGFNLDEIYPKVTAEECAQIVAEADLMSGKSPAVNRIFDDRWNAKRNANKPAETGTTQVAPLPTPVATTVTTTATSPTFLTGDPLPAGSVQTSAPAPVLGDMHDRKEPDTTEEMSDEEWLKKIGVTA